MEVDLQSLREIAATNYIRAVEEAYGENGLQALRRLTPYAPSYEGIEIDGLLAWCRAGLDAGRCPPLPEAG